MTLRTFIGRTAVSLLIISLAACGGGGSDAPPPTFTIGGTVTGLAAGAQITLNDNGNDPLMVSANGSFTFTKSVDNNGTYAVTLGTPLPTGQTCTVSNASGAGVTANVATVKVTCSPITYTIGGTVTGLAAGQQISLLDNGADPIAVTADGTYAFATPVAYNGGYAVTIGTQPVGQTCTVANGAGTGVVANVANVNVTCSTNTFAVGGTVTGLAAGQQVTLINGADVAGALTVTADGTYSFATPVAYNGNYAVTIGTQPTGQTCTVANGSGTGVTAVVSNANITCSTNTYQIGGTITGLIAGQQVTLVNSGDMVGAVTATADGTYNFTTQVAYNGSFAVTIGTQPIGETCTVANGAGTGVTANVANVNITCSVHTFTIGGTVTGLASGQQVTLVNGSDVAGAVTATADGGYTFSTPVAYNGSYAVAIGTQPTGQTCTVGNGAGTGVTANVANVNITCSTNTYTIGGTVTGLTSGQQFTLVNGSDVAGAVTVTADGSYAFTTPVAYNGNYSVAVGTQPIGQTCTVTNNAGTGVTANVANVNVSCSTNTFTIGGSVSGLTSGQVTLVNGSDVAGAVTVSANGTYTFTNPVAYNGNYAVTIGTQPVGQTCTVANPSGAGVTANVANVNVTCAVNTYTISGTVSGLTSGQVTLLNNNDMPTAQTVTTNGGSFSFTVNYGGSYSVTVGTQPVGMTCSVSNGTGTNVSASVSNVGVSCAVNTYTISGTVPGLATGQQVTLLNNNDVPTAQTVTTNNGTFSFTVNYGGSYSVSVGTQPTAETCTVTNGAGTGVTANATVGVNCRLPIAYVTNADDNSVSQYSVNVDGTLTSLGTIATGLNPNLMAVDPAGRFAYVANWADNTISQYTIGANGQLSALGTPVTTATNPSAIAIEKTGKYLYVTNDGANMVSQYTIGSNGMLTAMAAPTIASGSHPHGITVDPSGRFVYVANLGDNTVSQYTINATTGALGAMGTPTVAAGDGPLSVTVDPSGTHAYVDNFYTGSTISQFTIDGTTGELTLPSTLTYGVANNGPYQVTITPDGQYAYWSDKWFDDVMQCKLTAGALDCTSGPTAASVFPGAQPQYSAVDPFGRYFYAVNYTNGNTGSLSQYTIGGTGLLTLMPGPSTVTGKGPFAIVITR